MPDDIRNAVHAESGRSVLTTDMFWSGRMRYVSMMAAESTKFGSKVLAPEEIKDLEAAKHYIELAIKNDASNKAEKAA